MPDFESDEKIIREFLGGMGTDNKKLDSVFDAFCVAVSRENFVGAEILLDLFIALREGVDVLNLARRLAGTFDKMKKEMFKSGGGVREKQ